MKNIAYVCADSGVPIFGRKGCSVHVQEMIRAMGQLGASVQVFATRIGGDQPFDLAQVPVYRLPRAPKVERAIREQTALAANQAVRHTLLAAGPFDMIYERYSLWSYAAMEHARAMGIPGVLEVNAPLIEEQARHRGLVDRASAEHVAQRAFNAASTLIAVSDQVAAYLMRITSDWDKIHVVPNGVNPRRFPLDLQPASLHHLSVAPTNGRTTKVRHAGVDVAAVNKPEDSGQSGAPGGPGDSGGGVFTVGFLGTLKPWHGLQTLVQAFSMLYQSDPHARLLVVGDGAERENLIADLSRHGLLEATVLAGAVGPDQVPGLLAAMDVAVAPYPARLDFYFSPLKVYEYMAAGRAVVASRIGQVEDLIEDRINGLLCRPGDPASLFAALQELRDHPAWRARMGRTARSAILRSHTWQAVARRIFDVAGCSEVIGSVPAA